ncbi:MAG: DNA cytosine methyltransferase [Candidatus Riflebacteria bacterium]|nr:DNA cytosine methyltransferase [Candidatus Riflebacteria bacterium]
MTAVELFSGIGGFSAAARELGVQVVAAFDQNEVANRVYRANFDLAPCARNLDSLPAGEIPDADLWWLSPPCTPYSVRGHRHDDRDPRAASLINLIDAAATRLPRFLLVENVRGFMGSRVHERLGSVLTGAGYAIVETQLCPTRFGAPMRRPRLFVVASRSGPVRLSAPPAVPLAPLAGYLSLDQDLDLRLSDPVVRRYGRALNVLDRQEPEATLICITRGYGRSMRAGGSYVRTPDRGIRRLGPEELLGLFGLPASFRFPREVSREQRWRLVGNSVDVRAVRFLLKAVLQHCEGLGSEPDESL